ncbi:MAG: NAD(P)H-binding protein [Acidimicrobiia bacterium]|nr:NAD(P)H-binding protein [Acidimicrobiia bacterium]
MTIALLGGTGLLGRAVSTILAGEGIEHRVVGRSARGHTGVVADFATGSGIDAAISGCDTVVLLASNPSRTKQVDIGGTDKLLPLLDGKHLIYMSIVGVDRHPFPYYQAKHEVEEMIRSSGVGYSILRATQFHDFLAFLFSKMTKSPVAVAPRGFVFQPVETSEVAAHLVDVARTGPSGSLPDLGGPEILGIEHLARSYMEATGKERPLLKVPIPGQAARAFRQGVHTNPDRAVGRRTWAEYLERHRSTTWSSDNR